MARTREQIVEEGIDKGLSNEQIAALVKSELAAAPAAPAAPVRAVKPPTTTTPRPAPAAATKPPPLATLATSRAKAPPPAEPAMEAMPAAVTPIVAPAQTPPAAPVVAAPAPPRTTMSEAQLATEEQIQLERMLAEQDAIREAQNVGYVREAMMPLAALAAPAVLATGPFSAPLATVAAFAPGAAAAFPQAVAGGLSKMGFYGKTEATPAMRQEARRRALAAAGTQQYAASDRNEGSYLSEGVLDLLPSVTQPFVAAAEAALSVPRAAAGAMRKLGEMEAQTAYGKMAKASAGKQLTPKMGPQTPEEFALYKGGEFAENARRVKAAPEKFIPVGPSAPKGRATGREYELVVSPKVAYREHNAQFQDWAKRFPKEAEAVRAEVAKESAAERSVRKAETATSEVVAQVRAGRIPTAEQLGVSREERISLLKIAGLTPADLRANSMSEESATRLSEALKATRTPAP